MEEAGLATMEEQVVAPAPEGEPQASGSDMRDPERFYCPHPGCNRSFAELWRLKVHYRAPPDVRGSGKERGHGTELEFCPKCNKDLKPGKHHVGCSASKRQSKRPRQNADASDQPDSTRPRTSGGTGDGKQIGIKAEDAMDPWSASGMAMAAAAVKLPHHPLQHHPPGMPAPTYYYATHTPNGMAPMAIWPPPGPTPFAVLPAPGPMPHHFAPPQLVAFHHPGMPHPTYHAMPQMPMQPQPSVASMVPQQMLPPVPAAPAPAPALSMPCPEEQARNAQLAGMFDDEELDLARMPSPPPLPPDFSGSGAAAAAGQPAPSTTSNHLLFNFGQFSQRMPSSQPLLTGPNKLVKDLTQEAIDLAKANVVYETHDDGDLMELLFGVADEMPTMATFHLHKFPNEEQDGQQLAASSAAHAQQQEQLSRHQQEQQMAMFGSSGNHEQQQQQATGSGQQQQHQAQQHMMHGSQVAQQQGHSAQQLTASHGHGQPVMQGGYHHMVKQEPQLPGQVPGVNGSAVGMAAMEHAAQQQQQQLDGYSSMQGHALPDAYDKSTESVLTKESMMNNADSWTDKHHMTSGLFDCG